MLLRYIKHFPWAALALVFAGLAALAIFAVLTPAPVQAASPAQAGGPVAPLTQGNATPNDVNRVAKQLYCPVCPNTPLNVCETQACKDWRELIRQKLAAGAGDQEIVDYFVAQYGQRVLATPPPQGFNMLIWIIPVAALAASLAALGLVLRSWSLRRGNLSQASVTGNRARVTAPEPGTGELLADYVARVERELQGMRSQ